MIRFEPVLKHYRGFWPSLVSDKSRRFSKWYEAIKAHPAVKATTSTDQLYTDSYHRYANNIPNLSQVCSGALLRLPPVERMLTSDLPRPGCGRDQFGKAITLMNVSKSPE